MDKWKSIFRAPFDRDIEVWVTDGVEEYCLGYPCRRTEEGWLDAKHKTPLPNRLKVMAWREQRTGR
jgi:hypothetical protein